MIPENKICMLTPVQLALRSYFVDVYTLEYGMYNCLFDPVCVMDTKAKAILRYDLMGRTEPLYDNEGGCRRRSLDPAELGNFARIR